jgi:hypothetical protein
MKLALVLAALVGTNAGAFELTKENFDDAISGKGAFVKFLAPW